MQEYVRLLLLVIPIFSIFAFSSYSSVGRRPDSDLGALRWALLASMHIGQRVHKDDVLAAVVTGARGVGGFGFRYCSYCRQAPTHGGGEGAISWQVEGCYAEVLFKTVQEDGEVLASKSASRLIRGFCLRQGIFPYLLGKGGCKDMDNLRSP